MSEPEAQLCTLQNVQQLWSQNLNLDLWEDEVAQVSDNHHDRHRQPPWNYTQYMFAFAFIWSNCEL